MTKLTEEEKHDPELKKTQLIKAQSVTETNSEFADPAMSKLPNVIMKGRNKVPARYLAAQTLEAVKGKQIGEYGAAAVEQNQRWVQPLELRNCDPASTHPCERGGPEIKKTQDMSKMSEATRRPITSGGKSPGHTATRS